MGEDRQRRAQGLVEQHLAGGVGHVVLAADHVGDAVADVVDHVAQQVERLAVGTDDDKVLDVAVGPLDPAQHLVVVEQVARADRHLEADDRGQSLRFFRLYLRGAQMTAGAVITDLAFLGGQGGFPLPFQFLPGAEALVGVAGGQETVGRLDVVNGKLGLEVGPFVPVDAEPLQTVDDAVDRCLGGALLVGVFDAQDQLALVFFGEQPVEQGRPGPADVQVTGGTGWEANAYLLHAALLGDGQVPAVATRETKKLHITSPWPAFKGKVVGKGR